MPVLLTFHYVIPVRDAPVSRFLSTVESLAQQTALSSRLCQIQVTVVGERAQWYCANLQQLPTEMTLSSISESDSSLYDAVSKGLRHATGDVFGYLGVGDRLEPQAFELIMELAPSASVPWWLTGMIVGRRADGAIVRTTLPPRYKSRFFDCGLYGTRLPSVQQESTVWSRGMNSMIDWPTVASLRLAGDYLLWLQMVKISPPIVVEAALASFRWHLDNLSSDHQGYVAEVRSFTRRASFIDRLMAVPEAIRWAAPNRLKRLMHSGQVRWFEWPEGPWRP